MKGVPNSQDGAPFGPYKIMNNKMRRIEVPRNSEKPIQRRPKRCHLCKKSFPPDKYNEHFQTCYRFGDKKAEADKKPEQTRLAEKNRVNASGAKKEEKAMKGREGADVGGRFRIKNVSNLTQTSKAEAPPAHPIEQQRLPVSSNVNERQQERSVSIDIRAEQNRSISPTRDAQRPATSHIEDNTNIQNPEQSQIQVNRTELSSNRQPNPQPARQTIHQNTPNNIRNQRVEEPIVVLPPQNVGTIARASQNQPYDMQALMENTNSIIAFIRAMNANGEDESLNLMMGQLEQLNRIAEQIAELNQIGRSLSFRMGNVFAARIHEVQSTIVNQIGIALIRGFNNRLGSEFDAIAQRQPEIKVGFTQREMDATFSEKLSIEQSECSICLEEIPAADVIIELQCDHLFHPSCIREWLRGSKKCPMCRHVQQPTQ